MKRGAPSGAPLCSVAARPGRGASAQAKKCPTPGNLPHHPGERDAEDPCGRGRDERLRERVHRDGDHQHGDADQDGSVERVGPEAGIREQAGCPVCHVRALAVQHEQPEAERHGEEGLEHGEAGRLPVHAAHVRVALSFDRASEPEQEHEYGQADGDREPEPGAARLRGNGLEQAAPGRPQSRDEQDDVRGEIAELHVHYVRADRLHEADEERDERDERGEGEDRGGDRPGP